MNCSKCGSKIIENTNSCPVCGSDPIQNNLIFTENISPFDLNTTSKKTIPKKIKIPKSLIIIVLLVIVLLSVGFASYYITFEKITSDNLKKLEKERATIKNKATSKVKKVDTDASKNKIKLP